MKQGETIHLGDGVYLQFDGFGHAMMANSHENPTDTVYLEPQVLAAFLKAVGAKMPGKARQCPKCGAEGE